MLSLQRRTLANSQNPDFLCELSTGDVTVVSPPDGDPPLVARGTRNVNARNWLLLAQLPSLSRRGCTHARACDESPHLPHICGFPQQRRLSLVAAMVSTLCHAGLATFHSRLRVHVRTCVGAV